MATIVVHLQKRVRACGAGPGAAVHRRGGSAGQYPATASRPRPLPAECTRQAVGGRPRRHTTRSTAPGRGEQRIPAVRSKQDGEYSGERSLYRHPSKISYDVSNASRNGGGITHGVHEAGVRFLVAVAPAEQDLIPRWPSARGRDKARQGVRRRASWAHAAGGKYQPLT